MSKEESFKFIPTWIASISAALSVAIAAYVYKRSRDAEWIEELRNTFRTIRVELSLLCETMDHTTAVEVGRYVSHELIDLAGRLPTAEAILNLLRDTERRRHVISAITLGIQQSPRIQRRREITDRLRRSTVGHGFRIPLLSEILIDCVRTIDFSARVAVSSEFYEHIVTEDSSLKALEERFSLHPEAQMIERELAAHFSTATVFAYQSMASPYADRAHDLLNLLSQSVSRRTTRKLIRFRNRANKVLAGSSSKELEGHLQTALYYFELIAPLLTSDEQKRLQEIRKDVEKLQNAVDMNQDKKTAEPSSKDFDRRDT